jgi:RNA polymerase sigma-70 factor (ECF subfamily)
MIVATVRSAQRPAMSDHDDRIEELLTHGPWLEQLAHRLVNDPHTAQDAVQSTWLNALRRPPDRGGSGRAWLRTVLVREVHLAHRKRNRSRTNEELARADEDLGTDPASEAEASELRAELVLVLRGIAEPFRTTLRLHFLDELSSKEIAEKLGIPAATVRWRVMTGLERLRAELRRRHPDRPLHVLLLPLTRLAAPGALDPAEADGAESSSRPSRRRWIRSYAVVAGVLVAVFLGQLVWRSGSGAVATADLGAAGGTSVADASLASSPSPGDRLPGAASPAPLSGSAVPAGSASSASPGFEVEVEVADAERPAAIRGRRPRLPALEPALRGDRAHGRVGARDSRRGSRGPGRLGREREPPGAWRCARARRAGRSRTWCSRPRGAAGGPCASCSPRARSCSKARSSTTAVFRFRARTSRSGTRRRTSCWASSTPIPRCLTRSDPSPTSRGGFAPQESTDRPGRVRVHAWREGHVPAFLQQIADGTAEKHCRIVLSRGGTVRGEIRRADGEPVASARIWHEPEERGGDAAVRSAGYVPRLRGFSAAAETDAAGEFEMRGVPAGAILLWAQDPASPGLVAAGVVDVALGETSEWNAQVELREPLRIDLTGVAESSSGWIVRVWFAGPGRTALHP